VLRERHEHLRAVHQATDVATTLLAAAIILSGIGAFSLLPVSPLPRVDFPTNPGDGRVAGGESGDHGFVGRDSARTALRAHRGHHGDHRSSSTLGATQLTLQFDLDRDVDAAARDVQAAIAAAGGELPPNLPLKPSYRKVNPADSPILILSLASDALPLSQVFEAGNTVLAQKISQVEGVGQVTVGGGQQPAVRVQVDPRTLAGRGLGLEDIRAAIARSSVDSAARLARRPESNGRHCRGRPALRSGSLQAHRRRVPRRRDRPARGRRDRLRRRRERPPRRLDERTALGARAHPEATRRQHHRDESAHSGVASVLDAVHFSRHQGSTWRSTARRRSRAPSRDVEHTLVLSVLLVIGVVFVFLRELRATAIPSVAVPLSLLGTFGVMYLLDYSPGQPVAHGAHDLDGVRRRRRHRRHRKRDALHRGGKTAGRSGARGGPSDRLHHHLDHRVARRGVHPDPDDGRHRRPIVPRIRRHVVRRNRALGRRLAHVDPDDVLASSPTPRNTPRAPLHIVGARIRRTAEGVRTRARLGSSGTGDSRCS